MVVMKSLNVGGAADDRMERLAHPEGFSPAGLKVLVVDDDLLCLMILERMLRQCKYAGEWPCPHPVSTSGLNFQPDLGFMCRRRG